MNKELRKLAAELRRQADEYDQKRVVKIARVVRGAVGLRLLQRKLGRNG